MRYWIYYSTWLSRSFQPEHNGQAEMFCTIQVPAPKGRKGGASQLIFLHGSQGRVGICRKDIVVYMIDSGTKRNISGAGP